MSRRGHSAPRGPGWVRGAALALALGAPPAPAAEASYLVSARSDVRTRTPLPGDRSPVVSGDLELTPSARLGLRWSTSGLSLQYHPSLLLREPHARGPVTVLHRARLHFTRRWESAALSLLQEGAAGMLDVGALRPLDGAAPTDNPVAQTVGLVPYLRLASTAALDAAPTTRTTLALTAGYSLSGSSEAPTALPLQWGPQAAARLRWTVTPVDWVTAEAEAMAAWFLTGQEQRIASLTGTWERRLSRTVTAFAGAGAAVTRERIVPLPLPNPPLPGTYVEVLPVATLGAAWQQLVRSAPLRLNATVSMAPFADRFTGFVYERLEARVQGAWQPRQQLTFTGAAGAAYAVPVGRSEQVGDRLVFVEGGGAFLPNDWLVLAAMARVMWVEQPRFGTAGQVQGLVVLSATTQLSDATTW